MSSLSSLTDEHSNSDLAVMQSPFQLENEAAYQKWRAQKLELRGRCDSARIFRIDDRLIPDESMIPDMQAQIRAHNFLCFDMGVSLSRRQFLQFNRFFGLHNPDINVGAEEDAVTLVRVVDGTDARSRYIPYTDRALNWHTDGYYNPPQRNINAFSLFCEKPAGRGGGNFFLDHEWVYLLIRDQEPALLKALMSDQMMMIPANVSGGKKERAAQSGPVFSISDNAGLNMRYSSRPGNIVWQQDSVSKRALARVQELLLDNRAICKIELAAGQGVICNNILHGRHAFSDQSDDSPRLLYRARYYDCISVGVKHVLAG